MGDAFVVSGAEPFRQRNSDLEEILELHAAVGNPCIERFAFHELHRQEMHIVRLFDRMDGDDVGVVQCGHGFRFALEA